MATLYANVGLYIKYMTTGGLYIKPLSLSLLTRPALVKYKLPHQPFGKYFSLIPVFCVKYFLLSCIIFVE